MFELVDWDYSFQAWSCEFMCWFVHFLLCWTLRKEYCPKTSAAHPQGLGRTVFLEAQLIRCVPDCSCFFLSLKNHSAVERWLDVRVGRLFSQNSGGKGEGKGKGEKEEKLTFFETWMGTWQFHLLGPYVCLCQFPAIAEASGRCQYLELCCSLSIERGSVLRCNQRLHI